ncbi:MAG: hypothetical protein IT539_04230 [Bradyrhizobiaceae bacterium]|nr:hypothetical protein [Bradyrhizobiaceae bacterium]
MPLYIGGQRIARIYKGAQPIARAYRGAVPVFAMESGIPLDIVLTDNAIQDSGASSYTFNGRDSGGEIDDDLFVLAITWSVSGSTTLNSVSIGGASAAIIGQANGDNTGVALAFRVVPSGSGIDLGWTFSGTAPTRSGFGLFRLSNVENGTPVDAANPAGGANATRSVNIDVPKDGGAIAVAVNGSNQVMNWTGAAQAYVNLHANNSRQAGAIFHSDTALTDHAIQVTQCRALMAAAWR